MPAWRNWWRPIIASATSSAWFRPSAIPPGHVSLRIVSRGEEALITGDFMHHPCQIAHPDWDTTADSDPAQGIRTRQEMFERLAGTPVLVIGTHFAGATAGHIVRDGRQLPVGGMIAAALGCEASQTGPAP